MKEAFVSKRTLPQGAASGVARSTVGENFDARRFQRFLYTGIGTPKAGTIPPTTIVR